VDDLSRAKPIPAPAGIQIRQHSWAHDNRHLVLVGDRGGDEKWQVFSADSVNGQVRDLSRPERRRSWLGAPRTNEERAGTDARVVRMSPRYPEEILGEIAEDPPARPQVYRANLRTRSLSLVETNRSFFQLSSHVLV
jgi:hypothetical protein